MAFGDPPVPIITGETYGRCTAIFRWSVAKYDRVFEAGIFTKADRFELLEHNLVGREPESFAHHAATDTIVGMMPGYLPRGWIMRVRQTLALSDSRPEPDIAVVRGTAADYRVRHPEPADIGLVIEIADTSLLRDQRDKARIYARAAVPVYWVVNLVDRRIEVYSDPTGPADVPAYQAFQTYQPGDAIPLVLDGTQVAAVPVADLLP